jgi:hypothetical protein
VIDKISVIYRVNCTLTNRYFFKKSNSNYHVLMGTAVVDSKKNELSEAIAKLG